jgi:hypothetical protein
MAQYELALAKNKSLPLIIKNLPHAIPLQNETGKKKNYAI